MTIRPTEARDIPAIADLAQDQRIRQAGWEPEFWAMAPNAREVHPVFLRATVEQGRTLALVAETGGQLQGYVIATPGPTIPGRPPTWTVDDFGVAAPRSWSTVGPALLAAVAARARREGVDRIVTPCPTADRARRLALEAAGLDLNCWFRHLRLDRPTGPPALSSGDDDPGLPLPHLHGLQAVTMAGTSVVADGAHALLSPSIAAPPVYRPGGTTAVADPVIGQDHASLSGVLDEVEETSRGRGDVALIVAVGPGEELLERTLDDRNYGRPVEWWALRPR